MTKLGYDVTRAENEVFGLAAMDTMESMPPGIVHRPEGLPQWLFVVFYEAIPIKLNGILTKTEANSLVIWRAGAEHYFGHQKNRWNHSWFFGNGSAIDASMKHSSLPLETCIPIQQRYISEQFFNELYQESSAYTEINSRIIGQLFDIWLQRIERDIQSPNLQQGRLVELQRYIDNHLEETLTLKVLAEHVGLSVSHLSSEFKKQFECSPIEYVLRCRLERARYLLSDHNNRISDIAARVGFHDVFHFSKMFKKRFGLSPRHLRKEGKIA